MIRQWIIPWLFLIFTFPVLLNAQDCGCYDCDIEIPVNSLDTFEFTFSDVLNDNLANPNQGVCGIEMLFQHNRVRGLVMTLISPSGQSIQLTGPNLPNPTIQTTVNALWNILFVRSMDPAAPDTGIPATWNNGANWVVGGQYSGSYYPFSGNLEDFNTGPVNGTWRLVIQNFNQFSNYDGALINFRIILCDPAGIDCCFADAGTPVGDLNIAACVNDSSLLLHPTTTYGATPPDTAVYDFTWAIGRDTVLVGFDTTVDMRNFAAGNYQVCGFAYEIADTALIPSPDGILRIDTLRNRLNDTHPPFCAQVAMMCYSVSISDPPATFFLSDTICIGASYQSGDSVFSLLGNYQVIIPLAGGCDSIVNLTLTVVQPDTTFLTQTICKGETYNLAGDIYDSTGIYTAALPTSGFCDSIIHLNLTVKEELITDIEPVICEGENYSVGDTSLTEAGYHEILLQSSDNCDSLVRVSLSVLRPTANITIPDTITCTQPQVVLSGSNSAPAGNIAFFWFTPDGSITSPVNMNEITASSGGTYFLIVRQDSAGQVCLSEDSVRVFENVTPPTVAVAAPDTITCTRPTIVLDGSRSSSGSRFSYRWRNTATGLINGATTTSLTVAQAGTYRLIVTDDQNGCRDSVQVVVVQNTAPPAVEAGLGFELNCQISSDTLSGNGSAAGTNFLYQWTGPGIDCCDNTLQPVVSLPGRYFLTVINTINGCSATDSLTVTLDNTLPAADAGMTDTLNCASNTLTLNGSGSQGNRYITFWNTTNGNILNGNSTFHPEISKGGVYYLTIRDTVNFCVATDSVEVLVDRAFPTAEAGKRDTLTCRDSTIRLDATDSSVGLDIEYTWLLNGQPVADTAIFTVRQSGVYRLEVLNTRNFCHSVDSVIIDENKTFPVADAGTGFELNCSVAEDTLNGGNSSIGTAFSYQWDALHGCFVSGIQSLQPVVNCADTYFLYVENIENGCISIDSVQVTQDGNLPIAFAGPNDTLTCRDTAIQLTGFSFPAPPDAIIRWNTSNGNILSGDTTLTPLINEGGIYTLTVTRRDNSCSIQSSLSVTDLSDEPFADAGIDRELNCDTLEVVLKGSDISKGPGIIYQWYGPDSMLLSGANDDSLLTGTGGWYFIRVEDIYSQCFNTDSVFVETDTLAPLAVAGPDLTLDCQNTQDTLNGVASSAGPDILYAWTTLAGNILSGDNTPRPVVNQEGVYVLEVINVENQCRATDSVTVHEEDTIPFAEVPATVWLQCPDAHATIQAYNIADTTNFVFNWTTLNGNILTDSTATSITVDTPGDYLFSVKDTSNHCELSLPVLVWDTITPVADAGGHIELDCNDLIDGVTLNGFGSSQGSTILYEWTTFGGRIVGSNNILNPLINAPGLYNLQVRDTLTHCIAEDDISVTLSLGIPYADAGPDIVVPCGDTTAFIDGTNSTSGTDIFYNWSTRNGRIVDGVNTSTPQVDSTGSYILTVTNTMTGCSVVDSVLVEFEPCGPVAIVRALDTVTCRRDTVRLDAGASHIANSIFNWNIITGTIVAGENTLTPLVTAGTYEFVLRDTFNNLTTTTQVTVAVDTLSPVAQAGNPQILTCRDSVLRLNGGGSSVGPDIAYHWSGNENIENDSTLTPRISTGGQFILQVTDTRNGCFALDSVIISYDTIVPPVNAGMDLTFPCDTAFIRLDGSQTPFDPAYQFVWSTGDTVLSPRVRQPGTYCLEVTDLRNGCSNTDCVEVQADQNAPAINASVDGPLTCKDTSVLLSASIPVGNMTIAWTGPPDCLSGDTTAQSIGASCPGLYRLTVVNEDNRCVASQVVTVRQDIQPPFAEAGLLDTINCYVDSLRLDATDSDIGSTIQYFWTGPGNISEEATPRPFIFNPGIYTLAVLDTTTGCQAFDSVQILADTLPPVAEAGDTTNLSCAVDIVRLNGNLSSRNGPYIYNWNTLSGNGIVSGERTLRPEVNQSAVYFLTVRDTVNGCEARDSVWVGQDTLAPVASILAGSAEINCYSDTLSLDASNSTPAGRITYRWSTRNGHLIGDPTAAQIAFDQPGWYFLSVEKIENGCIAIDSVRIDADLEGPAISIATPRVLTCDLITTRISAAIPDSITDYRVRWTSTNGGILSGDSTLEITVRNGGRYAVEILNLANGCSRNESVIVPVDTLSPAVQASVTGTLDCITQIVQLDGTGSASDSLIYSYRWFTHGGGDIENPTSIVAKTDVPGLYFLEVSNRKNGCTSLDSVEVQADAAAIQGVILDVSAISCYGLTDGRIAIDSVKGGTAPYVFSLSGNFFGTQGVFNYLESGLYPLEIEDARGCMYDTLILIENRKELLTDLGTDLTLQLGDSMELEALINVSLSQIDTFIWSPPMNENCETPGCSIRVIRPTMSRVYEVVVRDLNGCLASDDIFITVNTSRPVYIPSGFSPNGDGNNDIFYIFGGSGIVEVESFQIYDRWGNLLHEAFNFQPNNPYFGWDGNYRGMPMTGGVFVYMARIKFADGRTEVFKGDLTLWR